MANKEEVSDYGALDKTKINFNQPPIYEKSGDFLVPGEMARGPWFPNVQHGGAVAGVLARALEALEAPAKMRISSISIELFRKVPMVPIRAEAQVVRDGKRIGALTVSLYDEKGEVELARAHAMRIREAEDVVTKEQVPPVFEEDLHPDFDGPFTKLALQDERFNYPRAFEAYRDNRDIPGRGWGWWRLIHSLVDDEIPSPLVRTAATADLIMSANTILGIKNPYMSVNPDLFISLQRQPRGDWICLESVVRIDDLGTGETDAVLYDGEGRFGRAMKSLLIDKYK